MALGGRVSTWESPSSPPSLPPSSLPPPSCSLSISFRPSSFFLPPFLVPTSLPPICTGGTWGGPSPPPPRPGLSVLISEEEAAEHQGHSCECEAQAPGPPSGPRMCVYIFPGFCVYSGMPLSGHAGMCGCVCGHLQAGRAAVRMGGGDVIRLQAPGRHSQRILVSCGAFTAPPTSVYGVRTGGGAFGTQRGTARAKFSALGGFEWSWGWTMPDTSLQQRMFGGKKD